MNGITTTYASISKRKAAIDFLFKPYFNRVKLGEGGLVVFNLFHAVFAHKEISQAILEIVLSFFVMCALYGFNDFTDRFKDAQNSKKDQGFIYAIIQNERLFIGLNLFLTIATVLVTVFFLPYSKVIILLTLYTINLLYSRRFKSMPVIDIVTVGIWGGLYVLISGELNWQLGLIVGLMTSIAHLFQILTDKTSDSNTDTKTTVVAMPGSELFFLLVLCVSLGVLLFYTLGVWWMLSAAFPMVIFAFTRRVTLSWHFSRAYFFLCWMALLTLFYGGF